MQVFTPVVLLILIVCLSLGTTLLRMPYTTAVVVAVLTNLCYGVVALGELKQACHASRRTCAHASRAQVPAC